MRYLIAFSIFGLACYAALLASIGMKPEYLLWSLLLQLSSVGCAAYLISQTSVRNTGGDQKGWMYFSFGLWIWLLAQTMEVVEALLGQPGYGTVADGFWTFGYLPVILGLRNMAQACPGSRSRSALIAIFLSLALLFATGTIPRITDPSRRLIERSLDVLYFFLDSMLVWFSFRLPNRLHFRLLFYAFLVFLLTDVIVTFPEAGRTFVSNALDVPYFCVYMAIAFAALSKQRSAANHAPIVGAGL